jgi:Short repeat of unknown function (DUF308)
MFKSTSTSMIWIGIAAIIAGIIALVILFAVYAFSDAILQGSRAFNSDNAGPVVGHLLLGLIDIAAGVVAIVCPGRPRSSCAARERTRGSSCTAPPDEERTAGRHPASEAVAAPSTGEPSQWLARSASSMSPRLSPTGRPMLSCALRTRYWTVFLCSISRSAVVL